MEDFQAVLNALDLVNMSCSINGETCRITKRNDHIDDREFLRRLKKIGKDLLESRQTCSIFSIDLNILFFVAANIQNVVGETELSFTLPSREWITHSDDSTVAEVDLWLFLQNIAVYNILPIVLRRIDHNHKTLLPVNYSSENVPKKLEKINQWTTCAIYGLYQSAKRNMPRYSQESGRTVVNSQAWVKNMIKNKPTVTTINVKNIPPVAKLDEYVKGMVVDTFLAGLIGNKDDFDNFFRICFKHVIRGDQMVVRTVGDLENETFAKRLAKRSKTQTSTAQTTKKLKKSETQTPLTEPSCNIEEGLELLFFPRDGDNLENRSLSSQKPNFNFMDTYSEDGSQYSSATVSTHTYMIV